MSLDFSASRIELGLAVVAFALLAATGVMALARSARRPRSLLAGLAGIVAIAGVRSWITRFSLIHANFHATQILDSAYLHPTQSIRDYGIFHSLVYGAAMRFIVPDLVGAAALNEVLSAATLVLMAIVATRFTGARLAGALVLALGLLNPILMRLAGSEEGHVLAVFLAFVALVALEAYRVEPRWMHLVAAGSAATLMVDTKQIMFASVPCLAALGYARAKDGHRRRAVIAMSPAVFMLALRVVQGLDLVSHTNLYQRLQNPGALVLALVTHPFFDYRGPIYLFLPLLVVGIRWLARDMREGRVVIACLVVLFLSALWIADGQGPTMTFRLPAYTFAMVIAGIGAWVVARWLAASASLAGTAAMRTAVFTTIVTLAPCIQPGFGMVREVSPQTLEYDYLRDLAKILPRNAAILRVEATGEAPSYEFPQHLLTNVEGARVLTWPAVTQADFDEGPVLFVRGLQCSAYSFPESHAPGLDFARGSVRLSNQFGTFPIFEGVSAPQRRRPICDELTRGAVPFGSPRTVATMGQLDSPFVLYGSESIEVQAFELSSAILDRSAAPPVFEPAAKGGGDAQRGRDP